jgi:hypothetical protein
VNLLKEFAKLWNDVLTIVMATGAGHHSCYDIPSFLLAAYIEKSGYRIAH